DLMGHPWQLVVGPRGATAGKVELKRRVVGMSGGEREELSPEDALDRIFANSDRPHSDRPHSDWKA
ncbi:MAG TPA: His/Gly/Thr/Pro-type tRNA ligase C-terminal domain-containing protein, partial [Acetobacteraceae bacterium]|nr:His/Gly/Thr/Pro-type tRNA ligase C-terminal domain-containing protein [Acetobacteraceae bacterium]